jgi:hypothetical protein
LIDSYRPKSISETRTINGWKWTYQFIGCEKLIG